MTSIFKDVRMILIGEVQTGSTGHSVALPPNVAAQIVDIRSGQQVKQRERPTRLAMSADVLTGVDCYLPSSKQIRSVGTVASRITLTGGLVLQSSSRTRVVASAQNRRLAWSHYLGQPGVVETIGGSRDADGIAARFLDSPAAPGTLDLAAINRRLHTQVQRNGDIDKQTQLRGAPVQTRWTAHPTEDDVAQVAFQVGSERQRTIHLRAPQEMWSKISAEDVATFAEDIAKHEWLLTMVLSLLDRSQIGLVPRRNVVARLAPSADFLFHLWNPAATIHPDLKPVWESLDAAAGMSTLWRTCVERVRDQISLAASSRFFGPIHPTAN